MEKWFEKQSRLVQILLLIIPITGWIIEIGVRVSHALRKKTLVSILLAIAAILPCGIIVGWLDVVWCLLFKHLFLCD